MHQYRVVFTMPNDDGPEYIVNQIIEADTGEEAAFEVGRIYAHPTGSRIIEVVVLS